MKSISWCSCSTSSSSRVSPTGHWLITNWYPRTPTGCTIVDKQHVWLLHKLEWPIPKFPQLGASLKVNTCHNRGIWHNFSKMKNNVEITLIIYSHWSSSRVNIFVSGSYHNPFLIRLFQACELFFCWPYMFLNCKKLVLELVFSLKAFTMISHPTALKAFLDLLPFCFYSSQRSINNFLLDCVVCLLFVTLTIPILLSFPHYLIMDPLLWFKIRNQRAYILTIP